MTNRNSHLPLRTRIKNFTDSFFVLIEKMIDEEVDFFQRELTDQENQIEHLKKDNESLKDEVSYLSLKLRSIQDINERRDL